MEEQRGNNTEIIIQTILDRGIDVSIYISTIRYPSLVNDCIQPSVKKVSEYKYGVLRKTSSTQKVDFFLNHRGEGTKRVQRLDVLL